MQPAETWPWWRTSLLVAVIAAALAALVLFLPPSRASLALLVGVGVFVWLVQRNPAFWLRRLAIGCVGAASLTAAVPALSVALDLGARGSLRLQTDGAGWFAFGFLLVGLAFAALEVWRERPASPQPAPQPSPTPATPSAPSEAGLHVHGARDVALRAGEDIVGGNKTTIEGDQVGRDKFGGDQVGRDKFGGDQVGLDKTTIEGDQVGRDKFHVQGDLHLTAPGPEPAGFDLQRHLSRLLPEVDHINITGIRSRPGASKDALRRPIEELYTPLRSHRPPDREDLQRGERPDEDPESRRVELPELLRAHHRLLLEGQPGSGKTTFLNLIACMLARDLRTGAPRPPDAPSWRAKHLGITGPARIPGLVRIAGLVQLLRRSPDEGRGDDRRWLLHLLALRACPEEQLDLERRDLGHEKRCRQWDELLRAGDALLLLDGLDEVADLALRERVFKIFRDACDAWKRAPILVTSRPIQTEALLRMGFHRATIDPFEPEQVERFVTQWANALHEDRAPETSAREARVLLDALARRDDLRDLAANPVMLTCLCVVHWNEGGLPEGRARVYHAVFHWMLRSREEQRVAAGYSGEFSRYAFPSLALAMMIGAGGKRARIELWEAAAALDADVAREYPDERDRVRWAKAWLVQECEWSHLVEEVEEGELKFWHLTMQEFAAALALAQRRDGEDDPRSDWWPLVRGRLDDPQWRETLALLPGCLYDDGGRTRVDRLVERVLEEGERGELLAAARSVGFLGRVLPTMRAYKYRLPGLHSERLKALQARALAIFTSAGAEVPMYVRLAAAEALEAAGFPPPENPFLALPGQGVAMAKFPVRVGEFAAFIAAGGYADDDNWDAEGLRLRDKYGWVEPWFWEQQRERPNRPVTGVSWCEARAYCRWLERRLGTPVRLPTAAEWEFAASPDGRAYPWGDEEPTAERANFKKDVGEPTPVGVYPAGAGPFGHEELAGNVWEWCEDGEPEPDAERRQNWGDRRWIKGGSWYDDEGALAAASRYGGGSRYRGVISGFRLVVSASRVEP